MALKVVTTHVDDLTGEELTADQRKTVTVGLNGKTWKLDVSEESRKVVMDTIAEWTKDAELITKPASSAPSGTSADRKAQLQAIREWAKKQGMEVSDRGRIPTEVEEAFNAAH
ncbi:MAG: Lsr2 family protein [Gordonia sp. (in: high G+C Gram-positive bacteria)]|uniref:histone-like nucleoid-structuring protein Lsr2 n=1 Tax=Gordonia sp. (in: high G+C Gram-positive bacteria) TaxID=84139 RepID=UPI0039E58F48